MTFPEPSTTVHALPRPSPPEQTALEEAEAKLRASERQIASSHDLREELEATRRELTRQQQGGGDGVAPAASAASSAASSASWAELKRQVSASDCFGWLRSASERVGVLLIASDGFGWLRMASDGLWWLRMASDALGWVLHAGGGGRGAPRLIASDCF